MSSLTRSTLVVTFFTSIGLIFSFLSNVVVAHKFGTSLDMDAFLAATTLPIFIISILSGAFHSTFLPVFVETEKDNPADISTIVSTFLNSILIGGGLIAILCMCFSSQIISLTAPGFGPEGIAKASTLLKIVIPTVIFTVVNDLIASIYYLRKRFVIPSLNKIIGPILTISYAIIFASRLNTKSLAFATLSASFIQMLIISVGLIKMRDIKYRLIISIHHPGVIKVIKLMIPIVLSMIIYKSLPMFDRFIGSQLPVGSISVLSYAKKLFRVIESVLISGISISFYPILAEFASAKDYLGFKHTIGKSLRMFLFVSIPVGVFLSMNGLIIIQTLFERGEFKHSASILTSRTLGLYLIGLPAVLAGSITSRCFYALQYNKIIAVLSVIETILYIGMCLLLVKKLGLFVIPLVTSVYYLLSVLTHLILLSRKIKQNIFAEFFPSIFFQILGTLMGYFITLPFQTISETPFISCALRIIFGFMIYFLFLRFICKSNEAHVFTRMITNSKFKRLILKN